MSIIDAAVRWRKEENMIRTYCALGKIDGAVKYRNNWFLPLTAHNPFDEKNSFVPKNINYDLFVPFIFFPVPAGLAEKVISEIEDKDQKTLYEAELRVNQGDLERAKQCIEELENSSSDILKMAAVRLQTSAVFYGGSACDWKILQNKLNAIYENSQDKEGLLIVKEMIEANMAMSFLRKEQHNYPEWLCKGDFSDVPVSLKEYSYYLYIMYLFTMRRNEELSGALKGYIEMSRIHNNLWIEVNLQLISAANFIILDRLDLCRECIESAIKLSIPDRLVFPFIKFHLQLCGQDNEMIREKSACFYDEAVSGQLKYRQSWLDINNNHYDGDKLSVDLTEREMSCLILAKRGKTNKNISAILGISENTVKYHMANIMLKTGISSRKEL